MKYYHVIKQLILADFRERTRRYSFLLMLLGILFLSYLVITDQYTIRFGEYRGEFNTAWAGSVTAVITTLLLCLAGFYLVKNTIRNDRITNVGQILAATPISRFSYLMAKFFSNFLVLALMIGIQVLAAIVMYLIYGDKSGFNLWHLITPFIILSLPAMMFVAAIAVTFEGIRPLSGTMGNIIYFFLIETTLVFTIMEHSLIDLPGINTFIKSTKEAIRAIYPDAEVGVQVGFLAFDESLAKAVNIVPWDGIKWSMAIIWQRLMWVGLGLASVLITVPFFNRFDQTHLTRGTIRKEKNKKAEAPPLPAKSPSSTLSYKQIVTPTVRYHYTSMLVAELRLMLKGYHNILYILALGIIVTQLVIPFEPARHISVAAAMILPISCWSAMGTRETRYNTAQLLFSSPYPVSRQFPISWFAGVTIALLMLSGMIIRTVLGGEWSHLLTLLSAALFTPSLALAFGTVTGSRKLFEVIYLFMWYVGAVEKLKPLNFLGTSEDAVTTDIYLSYLCLAMALFIIAILTRKRQVIL